jgi:hypothetical protein
MELPQVQQAAGFRFLSLDQRSLKNRPRIKAGKIRPPETPSMFVDLNWQMDQ